MEGAPRRRIRLIPAVLVVIGFGLVGLLAGRVSHWAHQPPRAPDATAKTTPGAGTAELPRRGSTTLGAGSRALGSAKPSLPQQDDHAPPAGLASQDQAKGNEPKAQGEASPPAGEAAQAPAAPSPPSPSVVLLNPGTATTAGERDRLDAEARRDATPKPEDQNASNAERTTTAPEEPSDKAQVTQRARKHARDYRRHPAREAAESGDIRRRPSRWREEGPPPRRYAREPGGSPFFLPFLPFLFF